MIVGKHHFRGYVVDITSDTKVEDIQYIINKHPEFKKIIGLDNSSEDNRSEDSGKPKSRKGRKRG